MRSREMHDENWSGQDGQALIQLSDIPRTSLILTQLLTGSLPADRKRTRTITALDCSWEVLTLKSPFMEV